LFKLSIIGSFFSFIKIIFIIISGCSTRNENIPFKVHRDIKPDFEIYSDYEGKYQLFPNLMITITSKEDSLYAQVTGQPKVEIYPESEDKFFYKMVDAQLKFNRNNAGMIESITLYQNGLETLVKKLKK
jgi:hypothetical protein